MKKIRILLIEDNRILQDGIRAVINKQTDLKVVAVSGGHHDTLLQARTSKPHVVLIDLGLRSENGLRVVGRLTRELPEIKVIGMGLIPSRQDVVEFVQAGAAGFILKDATITDALGTIRSVAQGTTVLPPVLTGSLFAYVVDHALRHGKGTLPSAVRMTRREREVIVLIAEGMSNKEVAGRLNLSIRVVRSHLYNILEKMALHNRLEIAAHAFEHEEQ